MNSLHSKARFRQRVIRYSGEYVKIPDMILTLWFVVVSILSSCPEF